MALITYENFGSTHFYVHKLLQYVVLVLIQDFQKYVMFDH